MSSGMARPSVKFSMGKYLQVSQVGGIYTATNAAGVDRTVNSLARTWRDLDGDRIVDCDLMIPAAAPGTGGLPANGECAAVTGASEQRPPLRTQSRRPGRSRPGDRPQHAELRAATSRSMSESITNYCNNYFAAGGKSLIDGWDKREYEWQMSLGVQHEILPACPWK